MEPQPAPVLLPYSFAGLQVRPSHVYITLAVVGMLAFLIGVSEILFPFVVAIIAAYFLDPLADALERKGLSRRAAVSIITGAFFSTILLAGALVAPLAFRQLMELISALPDSFSELQRRLPERVADLIEKFDERFGKQAKDAMEGAAGGILSVGGKIAQKAWLSGMAFANMIALVFITPVVTFYMLKDWDKITAQAKDSIPARFRPEIVSCMNEIDETMSGYIRGQTYVCLILGVFYSVALTAVGLNYAVFIGFLTGMLCFLPYVGVSIGTVSGTILAYLQFSDWRHTLIVAGIFIFGQMLEGTFITPKLVGDKVKLHPVWIIFGMLAGGALFGFTGVLLAVPAAAAIGVIARRLYRRYKNSDFFMRNHIIEEA
ncbi:MAG: AI-2E family transporter [Rickettsiales bacterium]